MTLICYAHVTYVYHPNKHSTFCIQITHEPPIRLRLCWCDMKKSILLQIHLYWPAFLCYLLTFAFKKPFVPFYFQVTFNNFSHSTYKKKQNYPWKYIVFPFNVTKYTIQPIVQSILVCVLSFFVLVCFVWTVAGGLSAQRRSVLDKSVNVILRSVVAHGHLEHECNAQQSLLCVSVCYNLANRITHVRKCSIVQ